MKAMVFEEYGPPEVLQIKDVPLPVPDSGQVRVKVHATTVTAGDWRMRKADPPYARIYNGLLRPREVKILGFEVSGVVDAVGRDATRLQKGDRVFAHTGLRFGGYAEYICLPVNGNQNKGLVAKMPTNLSFPEAAGVPTGGLAALNLLRKGGITGGIDVLIVGASGSVGTFAVQLAKHYGASITAVCSASNFDLVTSLGAGKTIDYSVENFWERSESYDLVFDAVSKVSGRYCRRALKPGGRYVDVGVGRKDRIQDLDFLRELLEAGQIKPVIDRTYPFEDIPAAHAYVEKGHKKGNVVVTVP